MDGYDCKMGISCRGGQEGEGLVSTRLITHHGNSFVTLRERSCVVIHITVHSMMNGLISGCGNVPLSLSLSPVLSPSSLLPTKNRRIEFLI